MSNIAQTNMPPVGNIALDEHTKHFFPKEYHNGPVEKFFRPDLTGTREHVYASREAVMLTGERVVIAQHFYLPKPKRNTPAGAVQVGDIFVGDNFYPTSWSSLVVADATHKFWLNEVFGVQAAPTKRPNFPLQPLNHAYLTRCHKDSLSSFGLRIGYWGHCRFIDLRGAGQQKVSNVMLDLDGQKPLELANTWERRCSESSMASGWFIEYPDVAFHEQVDKTAVDVNEKLHQLLRFYQKSDDERAHEVFGCDVATVHRALPLLRLALRCNMGDSGPLAARARLSTKGTIMFRPFLVDRALGVPPVGPSQRVAVPAELRQRRAKVFKALKCHGAARLGETTGATYRAREIGQEWAAQFTCQSPVLESAHDVAMAVSEFDQALSSLTTSQSECP